MLPKSGGLLQLITRARLFQGCVRQPRADVRAGSPLNGSAVRRIAALAGAALLIALTAVRADQFEDAKKVKHDWRKELVAALQKRQQADGSFINKGDRAFGEMDPNLATGFAVLTLSYTKPAKK